MQLEVPHKPCAVISNDQYTAVDKLCMFEFIPLHMSQLIDHSPETFNELSLIKKMVFW